MAQTLQQAAMIDNYERLMAGRKNVIINGGFDFWQRAFDQTESGLNSADRWANLWSPDNVVTIARMPFTAGQTQVKGNPRYYMRANTNAGSAAAATDYIELINLVEGALTFAGEEVTLSFWARVESGAADMAFDISRRYGSGGTPTAPENIVASRAKFSLTTTWQRFTHTFVMPTFSGTLGTGNNDCLWMAFWLSAGSNFDERASNLGIQSGVFNLANVQFEKGNAASDFEYRNLGEELALCQRYFEKSYPAERTVLGAITETGVKSSWTRGSYHFEDDGSLRFAVVKRAAPTVKIYSSSTGAEGVGAEYNGANLYQKDVIFSASRQGEGGCMFSSGGAHFTVNMNVRWHWSANSDFF